MKKTKKSCPCTCHESGLPSHCGRCFSEPKKTGKETLIHGSEFHVFNQPQENQQPTCECSCHTSSAVHTLGECPKCVYPPSSSWESELLDLFYEPKDIIKYKVDDESYLNRNLTVGQLKNFISQTLAKEKAASWRAGYDQGVEDTKEMGPPAKKAATFMLDVVKLEARLEIIRELKHWSKGKTVTKDSLREKLNLSK